LVFILHLNLNVLPKILRMNYNIVAAITETLIIHSDEKTRLSSQHFFKESILCHGVKSNITERLGKDYFKLVRDKSKSEIFDLCEELWQTGYLEESGIACNWSYYLHKQFEPADFYIFEKWIEKYVTNWATCDTLCNHTVGTLVDIYAEFLSQVSRWARSENRWMKRASAVSLIVPARQGKFLEEILGIADILLLDKDDMVQKGYGWMLKAASQANLNPVYEYVMSKKAVMPRTSLRYAIEKMPQALKERAMKK